MLRANSCNVPTVKTFYTLGFQKLPDDTEKLICCEFVLTEGDTMYPLTSGFDYSIKEESDLVFQRPITHSSTRPKKRGYARIHLGRRLTR